ncbi:predicted protein [Naegleria gruberi]|uniref:Predicted protein n=1 Tax=Naegleria gruberi TaxID=5762 RepID=D2W3K4_NAEGR|nr:uncharacterized protein NAEGRDRAFT_75972 [Naegleria gruberi]EFC36347.1 predicted protein [Naegleria gruberi]|eukprot:XP_002669091.1 predicted protein [Naegleria gruberi strain NEG-M]
MASYELNFYRLYRPELYTPNCNSINESIVYRSGSHAVPTILFPDHDDIVLSVTNSDSIVIFLMKSGKVLLLGRGSFVIGNPNYDDGEDPDKLHELNTEKLREMDKSPFKQLCATNSVLYAVMESGRLFSINDVWKEEKFGQEEALHFEYVGTGLSHMMAITNNHEVYGTGSDAYGCLGGCGGGKIKFEYVLDEDDHILDVYPAYYRTLVVTANGKLLTTGWGVYSQQGLGNSSGDNPRFVRHQPMNDLGEHVIKLALGALHTIVLTKSRKVYGFGFNSYGQLSQGEVTSDFGFPVLIETPQPIVDIWCGWHHTLFESSTGSFYCSGSNGSNEMLGVEDDLKGKNIYNLTSFSTPENEEYLRWKIGVCSFSSNTYYHGIRLTGKRIEWMLANLKAMTRARCEYSDLTFDWEC